MGSNGIATSIESYRKGTSFTDWSDRLAYTFHANQVAADRQKSHFITICGPFLFSQLKLHYSKDELDKASYADIVLKLKQKLDKTEPDLVQRFRFSQRNQQPDESNEDFVQAVKLQAEFCGFGAFKDVAIMDRVLAGLLDGNLMENLLKEEGLTLDKMDKFITTWNIAKRNVSALNNQNSCANFGQFNYPPPEMVNQVRRPVHERLGSHPYNNRQHSNTHNNYYRSGFNRNNNRYNNNRSGQNNHEQRAQNTQNTHNTQRSVRFQGDNRNNNQRNTNYNNNNNNRFNYRTERVKPDYSETVCDYCGKLGHIKKRCFTWKNLRRDAVNFVEMARPGTSAERELADLLGRMNTREDPNEETSDAESYSEWNQGVGWKRGVVSASRSA
ncbi:nuclear exosome regulator NRDE2-like isoform X1 [Culex quinquefasciatus]|uniref:nuclear exosome regulator NRDE2-like isoform X1 n=1 Tax=Culex quinquefasciatus TaxID=7176 RepID=UPI0018E3BB7A|nr:nuclear exosome regulator NRDE2-like isoform X1 [Culex quinquefasciatus]